MTHVATLISHPSRPLDETDATSVSAVLPGAGRPRWLAPRIAVDIPFAPPPGDDNRRWTALARSRLLAAVDVVVQVARDRRKALLVADMDSTLIQQECIDELADAVGRRAEISAITLRSMRGEVEFDAALRARVALLRGLEVAVAQRIVVDRIVPMPGAATLVATMRAQGAFTAIASGGFTIFTEHVATRLGLDAHHANVLGTRDGRLDGTIEEPIFGRESKRTLLRRLRDACGLAPARTMAVGDGANDLAMLEEAGLGIAFHAQPIVAETACARIDHGDLTALLYLQGYAHQEFRS